MTTHSSKLLPPNHWIFAFSAYSQAKPGCENSRMFRSAITPNHWIAYINWLLAWKMWSLWSAQKFENSEQVRIIHPASKYISISDSSLNLQLGVGQKCQPPQILASAPCWAQAPETQDSISHHFLHQKKGVHLPQKTGENKLQELKLRGHRFKTVRIPDPNSSAFASVSWTRLGF